MRPLSKVWYTVEKSQAGGSRIFDVDEMSQYIDQTILLTGQAFNFVSYSRSLNVLIGLGAEKAKTKGNLKNQTSLLEEDSKELFGKSFRKHMIATAKAKKESKEAYRTRRVSNSDKCPFEKPFITETERGAICVIHSVEVQKRSLSIIISTISRVPITMEVKKTIWEEFPQQRKKPFSAKLHLYQKDIFRILYQCMN